MKHSPLHILLVEDDDPDVVFVRRALAGTGGEHTLHVVRNGEEATRYLSGAGEFSDRSRFPVPTLVLTDLKMPGMSGLDLLHWLRTNPQHSVIPTIVYSNSSLDSDIRSAYELGANSYIVKSNNLAELTTTLRLMFDYWAKCARPDSLTIKKGRPHHLLTRK